MFDVSVDIHPFNNSQYIVLVKLPSNTNLPALFPVPGDTLYPTSDTLYPISDTLYPILGPNSLYPNPEQNAAYSTPVNFSHFDQYSSSSNPEGVSVNPEPVGKPSRLNILHFPGRKHGVSYFLSGEKLFMNRTQSF